MTTTSNEQIESIEKHYTDLGEKHADVIRDAMRSEGKDPANEADMVRFAHDNRDRPGIKEALTEIKRLMEEKWAKIREVSGGQAED